MKFDLNRFDFLVAKCSNWSRSRNIITGSNALDQAVMLIEEIGELATGIRKMRIELIKDAIGDVLVVLNGMCLQLLNKDLTNFSNRIFGTNSTEFSLKQDLTMLSKNAANLASNCNPNLKELTQNRIHNILQDLNYICLRLDVSLDECLEGAYNEIKDRKGVMFNGTFIKESDPNFQEISRLAAGSIAPNGNIIK